jgi:preprotein translocase subunit SecB
VDKHPITVIYVNVTNIDFIGYVGGGDVQGKNYAARIGFTHSPYEPSDRSIHLKGSATVGEKSDDSSKGNSDLKCPFYLQLEVVARFEVDVQKFDVNYVEAWAKSNAPMLIMPYLREHVSSLAIRCGYPNVHLPLLQVPKYRSDKDIKKESESD